MIGISGFALFCEDIRNESGGSDSLIGVMPQGIIVPSFPFTAHKIGIYARLQVSRHWDKGTIVCGVQMPGNFVRDLGVIGRAELEKIAATTDAGYDTLGITLTSVGSYNFSQAGTMSVFLNYQDTQVLIAQLKVETP